MDYRRLNTTNGAALGYVAGKIAEFGNNSDLASYKKIFQDIETVLAQHTSRIVVIGELERQLQVQATIVDILRDHIDTTPCEQVMSDVHYLVESQELNELITKLQVA